ncbi:MAG: hypothetical protein EOS65_04185 [Mesorhizobium sp.]|uniref:hypothetical protein n=1 Tax=Mesorhizobium sp. TaxID=1871066 RepID=UPI000FD57DC7|nr:hypothetical protein [Mesorhizobium sp.]RVC64683.1 hypothetical protein EN779_01015 [Mesorhizobium sp. M4B.F.Ca.ET.088.02.2.1]RWF33512.1 MAG: hypothetical protein EOS45_03245 [Mesorhizobium sp.]RWF43835.1 MAG: hypothetical protein EOS65_04185 [Mesorhizobium sp.]TIX17094.1 MAG: hypothetical protein E5V41_11965 [Mesorhizobium sp.]TIX39607.1 MAG: hypothetical protein E5V40_16045 [Mesorhizobium sp.]
MDTAGREVRQAEGVRGQAINRRRMNGVDKAASRAQGTKSAAGAERPQTAEFQSSREAAGESLDDILVDFVMPRIPEPAILRRSVPILQHFVTHLVPNLEGGEQLKSLARTLMEDEIERHRDLLGRMQEGIEI